jgi:putative flavoprotein involved in K+ transport
MDTRAPDRRPHRDTTEVVVIGGGHAGLSVSQLLTVEGRDHVVLERGRVAERWRSERWDSLHLLTPNWLTRLPSWHYQGADQDGFMSAAEFIAYLERYSESFGAPVVGGATVRRVSRQGDRFLVASDAGSWLARNVVIATGPHGRPRVPAGVDPTLVLPSSDYRNPDELSPGGVLVIGASSSGVQIADELARAGREVTLAVGRHTRTPRRYRGMDAFWWLESTGRLARTIDEMTDQRAARREPSLQLVGRPGRHDDLDLGNLQRLGVRLVGRVTEMSRYGVRLGEDLPATIVDANRRLTDLLASFDEHASRNGLDRELQPAHRPNAVPLPSLVPTSLSLRAERISTVVTAAGYRPDYSWLDVPVLDQDGNVQQRRGVTAMPGLYVVGQRFQHRRDSGFIDGARHDAAHVIAHLISRHSSAVKSEQAVR